MSNDLMRVFLCPRCQGRIAYERGVPEERSGFVCVVCGGRYFLAGWHQECFELIIYLPRKGNSPEKFWCFGCGREVISAEIVIKEEEKEIVRYCYDCFHLKVSRNGETASCRPGPRGGYGRSLLADRVGARKIFYISKRGGLEEVIKNPYQDWDRAGRCLSFEDMLEGEINGKTGI